MKKINIALIAIISIAALAALGALLVSSQNASTSPPGSLPECNSLTNNPNAISILFFSDKETALTYSEYFLGIEPFSQNKENFNFFYINEEAPCEIYQGIALYCYNKEVLKKAAACPTDYIVVIQEKPRSIRSSAFSNVMSLNKNHPLTVFAHEFGHTFANKAEEYKTSAKIPRGSDNCVSECDNFKGQIDGCYSECTDSEHYRSIENGFMRTLSAASYGTFNEETIAQKIKDASDKKSSSPITGFAIEQSEQCLNKEFFLIEGQFQNGKVEILSKERLSGCANPGTLFGELKFQAVSDSESIFEGTIQEEFIFTTDNTESGEITSPPIENDKPFLIAIPAEESPQTLQITDENDNLLTQTNLNDIGARPCRI